MAVTEYQKTPRALLERLNTELNAALAHPEVRARLEAAGIAATPGKAKSLSATIRKELALYDGVVKAAGIKMN